ncbi:unnamed protein product [Pieris macdunnoughi]|uniref:Uncharacterized protein n=1 Tax=Pieris macdunnoughi TaxID=345717 RepID=A0A821RJ38_9NEOP|nr:unnamed protein product [Pieris macdunnoughi]
MHSSIMSAETGIMTHTMTTGATVNAEASAETSVTQQMSSGQLIETVFPVDNIEPTDGAWQTVTRRKTKCKQRFAGMTGQASDGVNFKAAERFIPIFISNVHKDTVESDIIDYVLKKTQVNISLKKISIKRHNNHLAYKFMIPEDNLSLFLDDKLWPKGIIFRRFVHYKNRHIKNETNMNSGLVNVNNG